MVGFASALVINIGTLSPAWVEAISSRASARTSWRSRWSSIRSAQARRPIASETARRLLDEVDVTVLRGNAGEIATLVGVEAEVRGVESIAAGGDPAELARRVALGVVASVTGSIDHVSDGDEVVRVSNGHALLGMVTGTGCMSTAITGCFLAAKPDAARSSRGSPGRLRRRGRGRGGGKPEAGHLPRRPLRRALQPRPGHAGRAFEACGSEPQSRMKLHALVDDLDIARRNPWRRHGSPASDRGCLDRGARPYRS